jgi:hypothetical protein
MSDEIYPVFRSLFVSSLPTLITPLCRCLKWALIISLITLLSACYTETTLPPICFDLTSEVVDLSDLEARYQATIAVDRFHCVLPKEGACKDFYLPDTPGPIDDAVYANAPWISLLSEVQVSDDISYCDAPIDGERAMCQTDRDCDPEWVCVSSDFKSSNERLKTYCEDKYGISDMACTQCLPKCEIDSSDPESESKLERVCTELVGAPSQCVKITNQSSNNRNNRIPSYCLP